MQGDACLSAIAACIKKAYANYGECYRIGGDEFCVLLKKMEMEAANEHTAFLTVLQLPCNCAKCSLRHIHKEKYQN